jgi:hypothetical protein
VAAGRVETAKRVKAGHRGDHRLWRGVERPGKRDTGTGCGRVGKAGHRGDHRLWRGVERPSSESPGRNLSASACEPFQEAIDLWLSRGRNAMAIWQDLVSEHSFTSSYQSVKCYIHKRRDSQLPQAERSDPDRAGRRGAGRLRYGSDGAGSADRQAPTHALVRDDAGL